jgi:16S rRNA (guanine966-N2)-methyltransferase
VRIIAGAWRGRPLEAPPGRGTRPTSDRAREGLFSMLQSRLGSFEGLEVADLFAGTGALGLEALSRGAAHCTFVEKDAAALAILRRNIARFGAEDRADVRAQAAEHTSPPRRPCDLVLMDPPYESPAAVTALSRLADPAWLAAEGWISFETTTPNAPLPPDLYSDTDRRFGKAWIRLLRRES